MAQTVKNLSAMQETQVQSLDQEDPLEKGMATHSSVLARRITRAKSEFELEGGRGDEWQAASSAGLRRHVGRLFF